MHMVWGGWGINEDTLCLLETDRSQIRRAPKTLKPLLEQVLNGVMPAYTSVSLEGEIQKLLKNAPNQFCLFLTG